MELGLTTVAPWCGFPPRLNFLRCTLMVVGGVALLLPVSRVLLQLLLIGNIAGEAAVAAWGLAASGSVLLALLLGCCAAIGYFCAANLS